MTLLRVLVVDDSLTVRRHLVAILSAEPDIEVVGEAGDGRRAIELCDMLRPDVITLDMMLPLMTGVAVTEYIMAHTPIPILIISASTNRGELYRTYDALRAGAVDVLEKPTGSEPEGAWEARFLATVRLVSRIKVITHPRHRLATAAPPPPLPSPERGTTGRYEVVLLGASTGGPRAIVDILKKLPANFALPILLVIHIGEPFGMAFADWLDGQTAHSVRYAQEGERLAQARGQILMAPPDRHLLLENGRLRLSGGAERHSCRPSVDVLFESVARECGPATIACLLTGMGRDGAAGLLAIRRAGGVTLAQDEATSVVYGMPREAALLGAAQRVLPLGEFAPTLAALSASVPKGIPS